MTRADEPAFLTGDKYRLAGVLGMTLREHYAGLAMQGLLANPDTKPDRKLVIECSLIYADALLTALSGGEGKTWRCLKCGNVNMDIGHICSICADPKPSIQAGRR